MCKRRTLFSFACLAAVILSPGLVPVAQAAVWNTGDVFVGIGNGKYDVYDNNGVF